jgi:glycosyltransferase involved in cell wall biosynthesis
MHLDWGYYDHPPMGGWLLWLMQQFSSELIVLRLPAILLWVVIALGMMDIFRRLQPEQADKAWQLGSLFLLLPFTWALTLVTTDTPLIFFLYFSAYAFLRSELENSLKWTVLCGVLLGLALLSKYFFPKCKIVYRNISMASTWVNNKSIKFYFIKWLIQKLDQVVSVGSAALVDFKATYQIPDAKGCVIKRGVINQSYQRPSSRLLLLKQFGFTEDEIILVHAGSFTKEKNHKFLIDCFEQIHLNEPRVRLLLVGEGPLASEIKQLVANRDIHDLVVFAGYQNHVQQIFAGADVFLLTSLTEGIPGVVLEAALQKLPVIAVNAGTINDFVINNVTGILVERHDQKLFSNAVLNLLKHKDISEQIVAGALNKVQVDHGVENSTIQFELLYNTILK